jgi:beta-ketoacyl ACP synthase
MGKGFPSVVVTGIAMTTALAPDAETTWKLRWGRIGAAPP